MDLFATLKQHSKQALQGHWRMAIVVTLVPNLVFLLLVLCVQAILGEPIAWGNILVYLEQLPTASLEAGQFAVFSSGRFVFSTILLLGMELFILVPLWFGQMRWYYQLVQGNPLPAGSIFYYFETFARYIKTIGLFFSLGIRRLLWSLLLYPVPAVLLGLGVYVLLPYFPLFNYYTLLLVGVFFLFLLFACWALQRTILNRYFLTWYIAADPLPFWQIVRTSVAESKGYRIQLLGFDLTFVGWVLLAGIFLPMLLFVLPYLFTARAMYACYVRETWRRQNPKVARPTYYKSATTPSPPNGVVWGGVEAPCTGQFEDLLQTNGEEPK